MMLYAIAILLALLIGSLGLLLHTLDRMDAERTRLLAARDKER